MRPNEAEGHRSHLTRVQRRWFNHVPNLTGWVATWSKESDLGKHAQTCDECSPSRKAFLFLSWLCPPRANCGRLWEKDGERLRMTQIDWLVILCHPLYVGCRYIVEMFLNVSHPITLAIGTPPGARHGKRQSCREQILRQTNINNPRHMCVQHRLHFSWSTLVQWVVHATGSTGPFSEGPRSGGQNNVRSLPELEHVQPSHFQSKAHVALHGCTKSKHLQNIFELPGS